jgi:hypothetical protein
VTEHLRRERNQGANRTIRFADCTEAQAAADILAEAAEWTGKLGSRVWSPEEIHFEHIKRAAAQGALVVGLEGPAIIACVQIYDSDFIHWPDEPEPALYVHKLAVRRCASGRAWLNDLINWAVGEAERRNIEILRLDTLPIGPLPGLYAQLGFKAVDIEPVQISGRTLVRMERRLDGLRTDRSEFLR